MAKELRRGRSLALCGETGRGKTHVAVAALQAFFPVESQKLRDLRAEWGRLNVLLSKKKEEIEAGKDDSTEEHIPYAVEDIEHMMEQTRADAAMPVNQYQPASCRFIRAVDLIAMLTDIPIGTGERLKIIDSFGTNYDCLCIDDIGTERETEASRQIIYNIVDRRYLNELSTIVTTNRPMEDFYKNDSAVFGRISEEGVVLEVSGENWRLR